MGLITVIVAAIAAYVFGAVWYTIMAKPWMKACGLSEEAIDRKDPKPYIISAISIIIVAGMMRHMFASAGITGAVSGLTSGLGIGLFIATPWIATNYGFANRPLALTLIDGAYATIGCGIIGLVLTLF